MFLAGVAHPVERHLAKVEVASSSLVTRSIIRKQMLTHLLFFLLCRDRSEDIKATVRWTVAGSRLDGNHTLVCRASSSAPSAAQNDFEKYFRFFKKTLYKSTFICYNSSCSGPVVQSVSTPACHAGGRRFESVRGRQKRKAIQKDGFSFLLSNRTRRYKCDCPVDSRWFPARREPLHNVSSPFGVGPLSSIPKGMAFLPKVLRDRSGSRYILQSAECIVQNLVK